MIFTIQLNIRKQLLLFPEVKAAACNAEEEFHVVSIQQYTMGVAEVSATVPQEDSFQSFLRTSDSAVDFEIPCSHRLFQGFGYICRVRMRNLYTFMID